MPYMTIMSVFYYALLPYMCDWRSIAFPGRADKNNSQPPTGVIQADIYFGDQLGTRFNAGQKMKAL